MNKGKVFLVGAGPSDVGLFTLKGKAVLEAADVVVYDALVGQAVLHLIPEHVRRIDVGKRAGDHPVPQGEINQILLREALAGNTVVRLKGGDPFLFGRGGEELELLVEYGIPFEIVPGVTSAIAVPAYAGIPVTHRDFCSSVHIITGHTKKNPEAEIDYDALVRLNGTLVFLMGAGALETICARLIEAGLAPDTPAAILERGTTAAQRRVAADVACLPLLAARAQIKTPAIIVVGEVCSLAEKFAWAEHRPLGGKRIIVTRPRALASKLVHLLREKGAEVVELPSIVTQPITPNLPLDHALAQISRYSWLVFTSPAGVEIFFSHLRQSRMDIRALAGVKLAAIGSATAKEIERRGLLVALMPEAYNAVELADKLALTVGKEERVLIARAKEGTPDLTDKLNEQCIAYDDVALYDTLYTCEDAAAVSEMLDAGELDYVAFTSASTVRGFVNTLGKRDYSKLHAVCIGQSTEKQAKEYGMQTHTAQQATIESMMDLMIQLSKGEQENDTAE
ncbi:uroporphyrinogen-III C-methyltransferase [Oscillospiraceae bacterium PP1C4]